MNKKDRQRSAISVSKQYQKAGLEDYGDRVRGCASQLFFSLKTDPLTREESLDLSTAIFCRVRHCPICQWRRSLMWQARSINALSKVQSDYPKMRWLFLTLTLKNCQVIELRETIEQLNSAFRKLSRRKAFPGVGWIKSVEVTRGKQNSMAHPHLHVLTMVKPSYFSRGYLSRQKWNELWRDCLQVDYEPILDVQTVDPKISSSLPLLCSIIKYQTKESELIQDPTWFTEYVKQLHKTRSISVEGILQSYFEDI